MIASPGSDPSRALSLFVERLRERLETPGAAVDCNATCSGSRPTSIFCSLRGTITAKGMVLPAVAMGGETVSGRACRTITLT